MKRNDSIKRKIFEIRRSKGISQERAAQLLDISTNAYRKIEKGGTILISERLWDIAKMLEISVEELILDDDPIDGSSLADKERATYRREIEQLQNTNSLLQQHIVLLNEQNERYTKR